MQQLPGIPSGSTVAGYVAKRWGAGVRLVPPVSIAVGVAATRIVKINPRRMQLLVANVSVGNVFVDWGAFVTAAASLILTPLGGSISLVADEDGELTTYDLWGIAPGGPLNVTAWEIETL